MEIECITRLVLTCLPSPVALIIAELLFVAQKESNEICGDEKKQKPVKILS